MKFTNLLNRKWNYTALAFLLPVFGMLVSMLVRGFEPFGDYSMLYSDMYHQYYPFFVDFRKALLSGDSLLYNWDIGMGLNYLGLVSYYLASPLNLLSVLVPEGWLLEFFSLLMPIKLGFAGMFFAVLLKKLFRRDDISITLFGCLYAYCAWALGYQWNIMWLDTFAMLPLVTLGMVALAREKKFMLYTLTLSLSILANYYIGLFVCIFIFFAFFCYEICCWGGIKKFIGDLFRIAVFSGIAIGLTAILSLPTLAALQTTQSGINSFPKNFDMNIVSGETWKDFLDAMRQVAGRMNGGLEPTFKEGLPNLYCGVGTVIFAFLFLTCGRIHLRDKLCSVFLLLLFAASFIIRQLDYIWHGFHFPNMIPYRFSFLYSFVLLNMAYRAYLQRRHFKLWQLITAGVLALGIMFCTNDLTDYIYWAYNSVFLLLYMAVLICSLRAKAPARSEDTDWRRKYLYNCSQRRRIGSLGLAGVMALELVLIIVNFNVHFPGTYSANYPKGTDSAEAVIRYMHEREEGNPYFRAEVTHAQSLNDSALNGYSGISTFTSSANVKVTIFMQTLGAAARNTYNRYCYEEVSPVSSLFLNHKYLIERDDKVEENAYFDDLYHVDKVHLLENNAYLPLGFLVNSDIADVEFGSNKNTFAVQNELFSAATGIKTDVWRMVVGKSLTVDGKNVTVKSQDSVGQVSYSTGTEEVDERLLTYTYNINQTGLMCIYLNLPQRNAFTVWKNGVELYSETHTLPQLLSVCDVVPGDKIEVKLTCKSDENSHTTVRGSILNEELFREGYDILAGSTLSIRNFENTLVEGSIACNRDGLLYTSIPQDGNWSVSVDGEDTDIVLVGNAMIGVPVTQGEHDICFTYENKAFSLGSKVTVMLLLVLMLLYWICYHPHSRRGKYEATPQS